MNTYEHVRDSLLSLKDLAHDQDRQIVNSQRKTQLFITLLYNLITGHDSGINLRIASETAKVAHEAKKDSTSMKIIAGVTMFYLPATFVCSLFGTNFVALNTNTSEPTFIVSKLWWVYIAFAVPLTAATIICFILWRRWRRGQVILNDRYEV
jgi:Mg2+ and Co2+ transporter CorA